MTPSTAESESAQVLRDWHCSDAPDHYCDATLVWPAEPDLIEHAALRYRNELTLGVVIAGPRSAPLPPTLPAAVLIEDDEPSSLSAAVHSARDLLGAAGYRVTRLALVCRPARARLSRAVGSAAWPGVEVRPSSPESLVAERTGQPSLSEADIPELVATHRELLAEMDSGAAEVVPVPTEVSKAFAALQARGYGVGSPAA